MSDRELMQQALDALEVSTDWDMGATGKQAQSIRAITALRARLAQPEQEIESDQDHVEDDGCPTEKAVLQRFWREHQMQEPVAWHYAGSDVEPNSVALDADLDAAQKANCIPLYAVPPQREWVGLMDEDVEATFWPWKQNTAYSIPLFEYRVIVRAIEAKLKEKNT